MYNENPEKVWVKNLKIKRGWKDPPYLVENNNEYMKTKESSF